MKEQVYLSAKFEARPRMLTVRDELTQMGFKVVSTWLDEPAKIDQTEEDLKRYADRDFQDVIRADLFIIDTFDENFRGGREVECGIALALQWAGRMEVVVVGPRRNVFHYKADQHFDTWTQCMIWLEKRRAAVVNP